MVSFSSISRAFLKRPCVALGLLLLTGCSSVESTKQPFTGLWVAPESESVSFELDLKQTAAHIEGYHAVLVMPSGRIEVSLPTDGGQPSVKGDLISTNTARVRYVLRKNAGSGEGTITLNGKKIVWKLLQSSGENVFPATCSLLLQKPASH